MFTVTADCGVNTVQSSSSSHVQQETIRKRESVNQQIQDRKIAVMSRDQSLIIGQKNVEYIFQNIILKYNSGGH